MRNEPKTTMVITDEEKTATVIAKEPKPTLVIADKAKTTTCSPSKVLDLNHCLLSFRPPTIQRIVKAEPIALLVEILSCQIHPCTVVQTLVDIGSYGILDI